MTKTVEIAYREGQAAFKENGATAECPYPAANVSQSYTSSSDRTHWWSGFLDARTDDALGHIFDRYKLARMSLPAREENDGR